MPARIAFFGVDESWRARVLAFAGYSVYECGTSFPRLYRTLQQGSVDAIVLNGDGNRFRRRVSILAHSLKLVPLILFADYSGCGSRDFDLVIPAGTPPSCWLTSIWQCIEESRRRPATARTPRERSVLCELSRFCTDTVRAKSGSAEVISLRAASGL